MSFSDFRLLTSNFFKKQEVRCKRQENLLLLLLAFLISKSIRFKR
jgi:hypothetical protein